MGYHIKEVLKQNQLDRPIHVISANMHSVMNPFCHYGLKTKFKENQTFIYEDE
jgi:hypothetical protein